jgi:hypothetical protein
VKSFILTAAFALLSAGTRASAAEPAKPNVVVILADDEE